MAAGSSLINFLGTKDSKGNKLQFGRADIDGVPFSGDIPTGSGEELDEALVKVSDAQVRIFYLSEAQDTADYTELLNKLASGWAIMLAPRHYDHKMDENGRMNVAVYCEWTTPVMKDGRLSSNMQP